MTVPPCRLCSGKRRMDHRRAKAGGWLLGCLLHSGMLAGGLAGGPEGEANGERPFTVVGRDGMPFVYIPAASFVMGTTPEAEAKLRQNGWWNRFLTREQPAHPVVIEQPFLMGVTEVTQGQWTEVMGAPPKTVAFQGKDRPVESVSFHEVEQFLVRLNRQSRSRFRLPTEAEWEYCCRAGDWDLFCIGTGGRSVALDRLSRYAWHKGNSEGTTHPAARRQPNAWGLYDMLGNVWEWCSDYYQPGAYGERQGVIFDPRMDRLFPERVMRGGSYYLPPAFQRAGVRSGLLAGERSPYVGFRLVCELD